MSRTNCDALTTKAAFVEVDVRTVALHSDGSEGTFLFTLATTDTAHFTGFHRYSTLVLVDAGDKNSSTLQTLLAEFDDVARSSLHTGTTGCTLVVVDLRNPRLRMNLDSIKLTG